MSTTLDELRCRLPQTIKLANYAPSRRDFSIDTFNPSAVASASDLPPYLILGELNHEACTFSKSGWCGRWQGRETDTHFQVTYKAKEHRCEMQQIWKGVHGDFGIYSASIPLPRLIGEALYLEFPRGWDSKAKEILQDEYQLTYVELQRGMFSICCIPDGAFRVIALPVGARNLRAVFEWLTRASETFNLPFPFDAYARPVFQAVNYLEGRAPEWTTNSAAVFDRSIADTGFIPLGSLVREKGSDGTAAWTLRREVYVVLINVPFGGMTEMLERLRSAEGAIRYRADRDLSFDLQPVVFPQGLDLQTKSIAVWDRARTTRSFWLLQSDSDPKSVAKQPNIQHSKEEASQLIRRVEEISVQQLEFLSRG